MLFAHYPKEMHCKGKLLQRSSNSTVVNKAWTIYSATWNDSSWLLMCEKHNRSSPQHSLRMVHCRLRWRGTGTKAQIVLTGWTGHIKMASCCTDTPAWLTPEFTPEVCLLRVWAYGNKVSTTGVSRYPRGLGFTPGSCIRPLSSKKWILARTINKSKSKLIWRMNTNTNKSIASSKGMMTSSLNSSQQLPFSLSGQIFIFG